MCVYFNDLHGKNEHHIEGRKKTVDEGGGQGETTRMYDMFRIARAEGCCAIRLRLAGGLDTTFNETFKTPADSFKCYRVTRRVNKFQNA